jgi:2-polyprenyl-3-methyl-5-hydroxy-6-metoxy-1,4-benzoquinol methylase
VSRFDTIVSLAEPELFPGGSVEPHAKYLTVLGADTPWAQAVSFKLPTPPRDPSLVGLRVIVDVEVLDGSLGVFAVLPDGSKVGDEPILRAGSGRTKASLDVATAAAVCFRNAEAPAVRARVYGVRTILRRTFDLTSILDELLVPLLKEPGEPALSEVARALSRCEGRTVASEEICALTCSGAPNPIPFDQLWQDEFGRRVLADTNELVGLLPTYDPDRMDPRNGYLGRDFFATYLKQSVIRVYHCVRQLREAGVTRGRVLDIGSLFGQFAVTLQRLGYQVTAVDRYQTYLGALDGYVEFMKREGVMVVSTTRENETEALAHVGSFDAVLAMAVVEHIPHTPRLFLEMLKSHVVDGGVMMLDTPNIARYWNRKRMAAGESTHQAIDKQYYADIPYEGHHREYTRAEMIWMLEQAGCSDIRTRLFDYNLLQFADLWPDHRDALLAMTVDPSLADTILISGCVSRSSS